MTDGLKEKERVGLHGVLGRFPKVERVVLFGSRAMGTYRGASDIDLALEGRDIKLPDLVSILAKIEDLNLPVEVELVVRDRIKNPAVEEHIRRYGLEWYTNPTAPPHRDSEQSSERKLITLRDAGITLIDCDHRTPPAVDAGVPYVAIPQMKEGRIELSEARRISPEHYSEWTRKANPQPFDVVLSRRCNPGETAFVAPEMRFALGQNLVLLRSNGEKVFPPFLRWFVRSPQWWEQVGTFINVGAIFNSLKCADIPKFTLPLPPLPEQKAIAAVLGALDDKIELNRRMNATLEAMARALFQSWMLSHTDDIQERQVQDLIDERVLLIGDGYRAKNSEFAADGLPFIRAGNLKTDGLDLAGAEILSARSTAAAGHKVGKVGDVAFTSKGTVGRITRVSSKTGAFVYSPQVCFWRAIAADRLHPTVLHQWMLADDFTRQITAVSTQTDMAPYVSLQDQRKMVIKLPSPSAQAEISKQLTPIDGKIAANAEQSRTLATLRDMLLPKLLSGELRVATRNPETTGK